MSTGVLYRLYIKDGYNIFFKEMPWTCILSNSQEGVTYSDFYYKKNSICKDIFRKYFTQLMHFEKLQRISGFHGSKLTV